MILHLIMLFWGGFTKQFGGETAPKVCNKVTKFHTQTFCENAPQKHNRMVWSYMALSDVL